MASVGADEGEVIDPVGVEEVEFDAGGVEAGGFDADGVIGAGADEVGFGAFGRGVIVGAVNSVVAGADEVAS